MLLTRRRMVTLAGAALTLAAQPLRAEENTPADSRLRNPGFLTVGTGEPVYPPWMLNDSPEGGEGFESALVYELARELGFGRDQVRWVRQTFEQAIAPGDKPFDFAIDQFSVTPQRAEVVGFSQVYFQPEKAVIALPESPVTAAGSFADLRRARWGAAIGTTDLNYLETLLGITGVQVYDDQIGVFQAMRAGQIDATVASLPTALFATAVQIPEADITALLPPDQSDRGHGLLFQHGSPLIPWIDAALGRMIAGGTIDELKNRWLVADADLPIISE